MAATTSLIAKIEINYHLVLERSWNMCTDLVTANLLIPSDSFVTL